MTNEELAQELWDAFRDATDKDNPWGASAARARELLGDITDDER